MNHHAEIAIAIATKKSMMKIQTKSVMITPPLTQIWQSSKYLVRTTRLLGSINDDGKKTKIVQTFEIIKKQVPKAVAQRKAMLKF